jgi:chromosome segregation ATPase
MSKPETPHPSEEKAIEKPKVKTKRLTMKAVWSEVDALKQGLSALETKANKIDHHLEGLGSKIEESRADPVAGAQAAKQISANMQSLNGNYLREVEEISNLRQSLKAMDSKIDSLAAGTKLIEESFGELSIEVDALKESIGNAVKKTESVEAMVSKLEGNLKGSYRITILAIGVIVILAVVAAIFLV